MNLDPLMNALAEQIGDAIARQAENASQLGIDPALSRDSQQAAALVREQVREALIHALHTAPRISAAHLRAALAQAFHQAQIPYRELGPEHDEWGEETGFAVQVEDFEDFERASQLARQIDQLIDGRYIAVKHGLSIEELMSRKRASGSH